jgi:hypothetical protein
MMMTISRPVTALVLFLGILGISQAQERARVSQSTTNQVLVRDFTDPTYIAGGARVYVDRINGLPGFENNLVAAFQKKRVNLIVVADRSHADFEINGFAQSQKAGWAKVIFGSGLPEAEASFQMVNLRTGVVAYAVASYKVDSLNGNKSTAEHLAKNLRQKMERDEKRLRK